MRESVDSAPSTWWTGNSLSSPPSWTLLYAWMRLDHTPGGKTLGAFCSAEDGVEVIDLVAVGVGVGGVGWLDDKCFAHSTLARFHMCKKMALAIGCSLRWTSMVTPSCVYPAKSGSIKCLFKSSSVAAMRARAATVRMPRSRRYFLMSSPAAASASRSSSVAMTLIVMSWKDAKTGHEVLTVTAHGSTAKGEINEEMLGMWMSLRNHRWKVQKWTNNLMSSHCYPGRWMTRVLHLTAETALVLFCLPSFGQLRAFRTRWFIRLWIRFARGRLLGFCLFKTFPALPEFIGHVRNAKEPRHPIVPSTLCSPQLRVVDAFKLSSQMHNVLAWSHHKVVERCLYHGLHVSQLWRKSFHVILHQLWIKPHWNVSGLWNVAWSWWWIGVCHWGRRSCPELWLSFSKNLFRKLWHQCKRCSLYIFFHCRAGPSAEKLHHRCWNARSSQVLGARHP